MITADRPITLQVPLDWHCTGTVSATHGGYWPFDTLEVEHMSDESKPGDTVQACSLEWFKTTDKVDDFAASQGFLGYKRELVKCMEPASYYVDVPGYAPAGYFCEFHRPRVRNL